MENSYASKAFIGTAGAIGVLFIAALGGVLQIPHGTWTESVATVPAYVALMPWTSPSSLKRQGSAWPTKCNMSYTRDEYTDILERAYDVGRAANSLSTRYTQVSDFLRADADELSVALPALSELQKPFRRLQVVLKAASRGLSCLQQADYGYVHIDEIKELLTKLAELSGTARSGLLKALLVARQSNQKNKVRARNKRRETFADFKTLRNKNPVQQLERFAFRAISKYGGPAGLFDLGMYRSESTVLTKTIEDLVKAEKLLLKAEEAATDQQRPNVALARAARMEAHADLLASFRDYDVKAAVARYKNAAKIHAKYKQMKRAARSLARLAQFLSDVGRAEEALTAANGALQLDSREPVATYVQVDLRRRLGLLQTTSEIESAEAKLINVEASSLESNPNLDASRSELLDQLKLWRAAADVPTNGVVDGIIDTTRACLLQSDAARVLLCVLCKAVFAE